MKNQKTITIAAILSATVLIAGIVAVAATPLTAYADRDYMKKDKDDKKDRHDKKDKKDEKEDKKDEKGDVSITKTEQKLKQKNVGSGYSENTNCGQNTINSLAVGVCPDANAELKK
jgi:Ni/Co efflux regulator RcnB